MLARAGQGGLGTVLGAMRKPPQCALMDTGLYPWKPTESLTLYPSEQRPIPELPTSQLLSLAGLLRWEEKSVIFLSVCKFIHSFIQQIHSEQLLLASTMLDPGDISVELCSSAGRV